MNNELLDLIRIANREFHEFTNQHPPGDAKLGEARRANRQLEKINIRLKQVAERLGGGSDVCTSEPGATYEVMKYRENLTSLQRQIESLRFSLLAEKARLENVRANLHSAGAWAMSLREIT